MFDIYVSDNWEEKKEELLESLEGDSERREMLEKLANAFFDHLLRGHAEFGGWGLDDKRPFGNSNVERDIAEILDLEMPEYDSDDYEDFCLFMREVYNDLGVYLRYRWLQLTGQE